jgi:hypothetical protein
MHGLVYVTGVLYSGPFGAELVPYETRDLGVTVLGQTGYGKTTLLEQLILQDIEEGTSVIVIDAHGDLTQRVLSLAETDDENVLLLEVWGDAPFRLNLFECPDPTSAITIPDGVRDRAGVQAAVWQPAGVLPSAGAGPGQRRPYGDR